MSRFILSHTRMILLLGVGLTVGSHLHAQAAKQVELTLDNGTWMSLDVSPDGRWIAFDLLNDIYVIPASGGAARTVHRGSAVQRNPRFSPEGEHLVYISDESGAENVWISRLDGSAARQLTHEDYALIGAPQWAPDGQSVVAVKRLPEFRNMRAAQIHRIARADGADEMIVPPPASGKDVQEPTFSPDGRFLYYTERVAGDHYVYMNTGLQNFVIRQLDLESGETQSLITGFGGATTPQVSPDGSTVAFIRRVGAKTVLFTADVASRKQTLIYDDLTRDLQGDYIAHEHYYPTFDWFPDNRHVAIWSRGKILRIDTQTGTAAEIPFTVSARHTLQPTVRFKHDLAPPEFNARIFQQLALHPDEQTLVYRAAGRLYAQDLRASNAAQRINATDKAQHDPTWSADGSHLAYVLWDDLAGSRLIIRNGLDGAERVRVADPGIVRQPRFSNNGRYLAYWLMPTDPSMNMATSPSGLYLLDLSRDGAQPVHLTAAVGLLRFAPDDERIYFLAEPDYTNGKRVRLNSIRLDGSDEREHVYAATRDLDELALSPDLNWLAFKEYNLPYLVRFKPSAAGVHLTAQQHPQVQRLSDVGSYGLTWAMDGSRLWWTLGSGLYAARPGATKLSEQPQVELRLPLQLDVPQGQIALTGARVLTMNGEDIAKGVVVVSGNRITAVGEVGQVVIPADAHRVDVSGKTIMPGFFDAHGHIDCCWQSGVMPNQQPTRHAALAYGITTNFDPYSNDLSSYESGEMTMAGRLIGPRWLSSGQVIYGRAGRADSTYHPIRSRQDAVHLIKRRQQLGHSILKSYKLTTREQRAWLLAAAREGGFMVDGEGAGAFYDMISMLLDGHTNIEHNLPVPTYYDDLLQLFAASSVGTTPTLIVAFGELFGENYIYQTQRPWDDDKVRRFYPAVNATYNPIATEGSPPLIVRGMHTIHVPPEVYDIGFRAVSRSVKALDDAGVLINAGSHGQVAGVAFHWELQLMAEGGMSPRRILHAATINPARTFGLDHQLGTLETGKLADLIVLDANPLADIRNTNTVRYTMVNGRLYDAHTMDEIGNHPRPREPFYWETPGTRLHDWNPAWSSQ